jgi:hypothetical protein
MIEMSNASDKIPELYETENIPFDEKIIYRRYQLEELGYYWLIAELYKKSNIAFGYANLNNDDFAEWGYISIDELELCEAELDEGWKPCKFREAMKKIKEEKEKSAR